MTCGQGMGEHNDDSSLCYNDKYYISGEVASIFMHVLEGTARLLQAGDTKHGWAMVDNVSAHLNKLIQEGGGNLNNINNNPTEQVTKQGSVPSYVSNNRPINITRPSSTREKVYSIGNKG